MNKAVATGALLALLAAGLFGASAPLLQRAGVGVGPFWTACMLYVGAAAVGAVMRRGAQREAGLERRDLPRLLAVALFGAGIGPVALAWGLQRASGAGASLMLTLEALFTAVLARFLYAESMDARVWVAMLSLSAGGALLVLDQGRSASGRRHARRPRSHCSLGVDNTLSRALADRDPGQVVMAKAALGAAATAVLAITTGDSAPSAAAAAALLAIGATGYGLSLRFYLLAQRAFGAARTGSVFAVAPFVGAALAFALGDRQGGWLMVAGGALMAGGVWTHLAERHGHAHVHEPLEHAHAHSHDDGHHGHPHDPPVVGTHSHAHSHVPTRHSHSHAPDLHHQHRH